MVPHSETRIWRWKRAAYSCCKEPSSGYCLGLPYFIHDFSRRHCIDLCGITWIGVIHEPCQFLEEMARWIYTKYLRNAWQDIQQIIMRPGREELHPQSFGLLDHQRIAAPMCCILRLSYYFGHPNIYLRWYIPCNQAMTTRWSRITSLQPGSPYNRWCLRQGYRSRIV